jgi:hypothetical protein
MQPERKCYGMPAVQLQVLGVAKHAALRDETHLRIIEWNAFDGAQNKGQLQRA